MSQPETTHPTIGRTGDRLDEARPIRRILAALESAELPLDAPEIELDNAEGLRAAPVAESVPTIGCTGERREPWPSPATAEHTAEYARMLESLGTGTPMIISLPDEAASPALTRLAEEVAATSDRHRDEDPVEWAQRLAESALAPPPLPPPAAETPPTNEASAAREAIAIMDEGKIEP